MTDTTLTKGQSYLHQHWEDPTLCTPDEKTPGRSPGLCTLTQITSALSAHKCSLTQEAKFCDSISRMLMVFFLHIDFGGGISVLPHDIITGSRVLQFQSAKKDQVLSLWSGGTDSKTLDYQRTNPREY